MCKRQDFLQFDIRTQTRTDRNDIERIDTGSPERTRDKTRIGNIPPKIGKSAGIVARIGDTNTRTAIRAPARHRQTGLTQPQNEYFFTFPVHII